MPFRSLAQKRYFYAKLPELAKIWQGHTPKHAVLPERVKKTKRSKKK